MQLFLQVATEWAWLIELTCPLKTLQNIDLYTYTEYSEWIQIIFLAELKVLTQLWTELLKLRIKNYEIYAHSKWLSPINMPY